MIAPFHAEHAGSQLGHGGHEEEASGRAGRHDGLGAVQHPAAGAGLGPRLRGDRVTAIGLGERGRDAKLALGRSCRVAGDLVR